MVGFLLAYLLMQKDTQELEPLADAPPSINVEERKIYTQAEKEEILAQLASRLPKDTTTPEERTRILKDLSKRQATTSISYEERLQILNKLASSTASQ